MCILDLNAIRALFISLNIKSFWNTRENLFSFFSLPENENMTDIPDTAIINFNPLIGELFMRKRIVISNSTQLQITFYSCYFNADYKS